MTTVKGLCILLLFLHARQLVAEKETSSSVLLLLDQVQEAFEKALSAPPTSSLAQCTNDFNALAGMNQTILFPNRDTMEVNAQVLLLDAMAKPASGIFQGDGQFAGSYDECFAIKILNDSNITLQYCLAPLFLVNIKTLQPFLPYPFSTGLCVPKSCNITDVVALANTYVEEYVYLSLGGEPICMDSERPGLTKGAAVMIGVSVFFVVMVIVGTIFDWLETLYERERQRDSIAINRSVLNVEADSNSSINQSERESLLGKCKRGPSSRLVLLLKDLLRSFSLYKTVPAILSTYQPPSAITSINGIRTISMFWVILAHVIYWLFISQNLKNNLDIEVNFATRYASQPIMNGYSSVDSFFFLSGLLVSYLTLRDMSRKKGKFPFFFYYVHRFLRLTPTYAFLLFFYWYMTMYLADGPKYLASTGPDSPAYKQCTKYWWTNLLYINNFYPEKFGEECMGWTWYLANDMQFFVITPLILIPLYIWLPTGIAAILLLLAGSFVATGFVAGFYRLSANPFEPLYSNITRSPDFPDVSTEIYGKPYARIAPYLAGIVLGYVFYKEYRLKLREPFNWVLHIVLWCIAAVLCISTVYGLHKDFNGDHFTLAENVSYHMFSRLAWGVGLALVVFACHNGYGGVINRFLSMPFWVPLSRFTFNAYLVHPIVLTVLFVSQRYPLYYTDLNIAMFSTASVVLSYGVAGVVCVFVEFPLSNLEIAVFKFFGLSRRESVRQGTRLESRPLDNSGRVS